MFRWWSIQNSNLKVSDDLLTSLVTIKDKLDNDKVSLKEHHFLENSNGLKDHTSVYSPINGSDQFFKKIDLWAIYGNISTNHSNWGITITPYITVSVDLCKIEVSNWT